LQRVDQFRSVIAAFLNIVDGQFYPTAKDFTAQKTVKVRLVRMRHTDSTGKIAEVRRLCRKARMSMALEEGQSKIFSTRRRNHAKFSFFRKNVSIFGIFNEQTAASY
jgi:hypothetical protein